MDFKQLASTILENVGGKENVKSVVHCATRLRFTLFDSSKANKEVLGKTKGVLKVVDAGGQFQIVIGPDVPQVYQEVVALGNFETSAPVEDAKAEADDNRSKLSKVLEGIASIFQPVIPAICGAGLLKAVLALCSVLKWIDTSGQTYIILNAMSDSAFYFLPILLAQSCAKKFKCNQGTAMALAGLLVYPTFIALLEGEEAVKIFNLIPVTKATYTSSVIPIILGVWFMSYVEHFVQKYCPKAVKFFFVPFFSLVIGGVVTICALGPIGAWLSNLIQLFFSWLKGVAPWLVPTVVGITSPLLVMTGTHYGLIPIGTNNLATVGHDAVVGPGMLVSNVAQGAAGLAVAVRSKDPEVKQLASSGGITGVLGITEPVLYGINLKYTYPLYAAMIGGGVGGLFLGLTGVERFGAGSPGLLVLPVYLPTEQALEAGFTMSNFYCAVVGVVIAMVVSFVSCYIMYGIWEKKGNTEATETTSTEPTTVQEVVTDTNDDVICAPCKGEVVALSDVKDEVFSSGAMGKGVAINPSEGKIYSPCDGTISVFFPTGHAIGLQATNGAEVLIHVGMDTVNLNGKGFTPKAKAGDTVKKGQLLLEVDLDEIKNAKLSAITPVIITNTADMKDVIATDAKTASVGDKLITIVK